MSRAHSHYSPKRMPEFWDFGPRTAHPHDPRNDPDDGLQPCLECDAEGEKNDEPCAFCEGKGYFLNDQPMSAREYENWVQRMREEFAS
jgi:hypothetical protein